jgi:regulator of replication initiation timing
VPQQTPATLQQPVQQQTLQQSTQAMSPAADFVAAAQEQGQAPQAVPAAVTPAPEQSQVMIPGLPSATVHAGVPGSKAVGGPELSATPASALRAQTHSGTAPTVACPPGMVPTYGDMTDAVSPPEKMAECEKQVHEMNQKLTELQFDTMKTRMTMEQMAEQQKQLLLDNERLRRRAEIADQRYLEELDSLSEIVGEVVSQAGAASKSNSAARPSRGKNPMRPVPQSAAGQSL